MNEELTIAKEQARLSIIGETHPDTSTDSGSGPDLTQELINILDDLGIDLPPIDIDDWDDIDVIIGYDDDGKPVIVFPDPGTDEIIVWPIEFPIDEIEWPDIDPIPVIDEDGHPFIEFVDPETDEVIDWPIVLPEDFDIEDWPDTDIDALLDDDGWPIIEFVDPDTGDTIDLDVGDLDIDALIDINGLDWVFDIDISGLDTNGLDSIATVNTDLNVHVDNVPTAIEIVTLPYKLQYIEGTSINLTGMIVKALKSDGSTWTSAKYPNGHIPLGELIVEPRVATEDGQMAYNIDYGFFCHLSTNYYDRTFTKTAWGKAYAGLLIESSGWHNPIIISDDPDAVRWHCDDVRSPGFTRDFGISGSATVHGLTVYYGSGWGLREGSSGTGLSASGIASFYGSISELLNTIVAGEGRCMVTIGWVPPGEFRELNAYFDVEVLSRGGGGGR